MFCGKNTEGGRPSPNQDRGPRMPTVDGGENLDLHTDCQNLRKPPGTGGCKLPGQAATFYRHGNLWQSGVPAAALCTRSRSFAEQKGADASKFKSGFKYNTTE
eukprot:1231554-Rhodomonas_salina.2